MHFIAGSGTALNGALMARMGRYRRRVFIETLGWDLPDIDGEERDQFDRPDTVYVAAEDAGGQLVGCARLLPTDRPYLLGEVFPQLFCGEPPPAHPEIWELSRFAAVDFGVRHAPGPQQFSSPVAVALLREALSQAAALGARRLVTVSPIGVERLLRRAGFRSRRAGPPMVLGGHPLFACWIDLDPAPACPLL